MAAPFPFREGSRAARRLSLPALVLAVALALPAAGNAASSAAVSVSATIVSNGWCWFTTNDEALDFGALDPGNPMDVGANATVNFRCFGFPSVTYSVDDDDGLSPGTGGKRMRHATLPAAFLPYSMELSPRSGTISWSPFILRTVNIAGTVRGADYQSAAAGSYSDIVVVAIDP